MFILRSFIHNNNNHNIVFFVISNHYMLQKSAIIDFIVNFKFIFRSIKTVYFFQKFIYYFISNFWTQQIFLRCKNIMRSSRIKSCHNFSIFFINRLCCFVPIIFFMFTRNYIFQNNFFKIYPTNFCQDLFQHLIFIL